MIFSALSIVSLSACSALQEPVQPLSLQSLRQAGAQIAEAAGLRVTRPLPKISPSPLKYTPSAKAPDVAYVNLPPSSPSSFVRVMGLKRRELRAPALHLAIEKSAVIAALREHVAETESIGDDRAAVAAMRKWLAFAPANPTAWLQLASLQERMHDDSAAARDLDQALRYDSTSGSARLARVEFAVRTGAFLAALSDVRAYLTHYPASPRAIQMEIAAARGAGDHVATLAAMNDYIAERPDDAVMLRARADELAADGDESGAIAGWKAYVQRQPDDADVYKQIAYASERTDDYASAVAAFSEYVKRRPNDERVKLAIAYDEAHAGRIQRAAVAFAQLEHSPDTDVAKRAAAELRARLSTSTTSSRLAFTTVQYDSRFGDIVFGLDTYALAPARRFQTYAVLHSWDDSRSSARAYEPIVYNDNAEVFGGGVRYNIGSRPGQYFFAEGGEQISLLGRGNGPELRYGFASWSERGTPSRGRTTYGFSVASYSRYNADIIGYGNVLHDFPLFGSVRGVFGTNFALDTHRDYWNNVGELEVGIKVGSPRLSFTLAGIDGMYLPRGAAAPFKRFYTTLRPSITWSPRI